MHIEYWSQEEIKIYCENPNLLMSRVNDMRYQVLCEILGWIKNRIKAIFSKAWHIAARRHYPSPHLGK